VAILCSTTALFAGCAAHPDKTKIKARMTPPLAKRLMRRQFISIFFQPPILPEQADKKPHKIVFSIC
jgi:hypothetical protein